jgi:hypothetical protein
MDPTALAKLRALALDGLAQGFEQVAADWAKLTIDRLPIRGQTLASLQGQYQELCEALPVCETAEVERLLQRFARGLRLHRSTLTISQVRFLRDRLHLLPAASGDLAAAAAGKLPPDDTWAWLQPVFQAPGSLVRHVTVASALYLVAQRNLSAAMPACLDSFREALCRSEVQAALVNAEGAVRLGPLIHAQSAWLAQRSSERDPTTPPSPPGGDSEREGRRAE